MSKHRIIYGPRAGSMRYVVQRRLCFFWLDSEGDDWIGWYSSLEEAEGLRRELEQSERTDKRRDHVVGE